MNYEKLDVVTLKLLYDEYNIMKKNKEAELKTITAELDLIINFLDHTSRCIYRAEQYQTKNDD